MNKHDFIAWIYSTATSKNFLETFLQHSSLESPTVVYFVFSYVGGSIPVVFIISRNTRLPTDEGYVAFTLAS